MSLMIILIECNGRQHNTSKMAYVEPEVWRLTCWITHLSWDCHRICLLNAEKNCVGGHRRVLKSVSLAVDDADEDWENDKFQIVRHIQINWKFDSICNWNSQRYANRWRIYLICKQSVSIRLYVVCALTNNQIVLLTKEKWSESIIDLWRTRNNATRSDMKIHVEYIPTSKNMMWGSLARRALNLFPHDVDHYDIQMMEINKSMNDPEDYEE